MMEPCNSLDQLLEHVDPSTLQGYKTVMQDVIIQGICHYHLNFNKLNNYLLDFNICKDGAECKYHTHFT